MDQLVNKNAICTVLFLDIVGYSEQLVAEQFLLKEQFNRVISEAMSSVDAKDRILLDTGDGAAIAFLGPPEDSLFIAIKIRDEILRLDHDQEPRLAVRIGVNLGPVRVLHDINGQINIIGDGINTAQRVMSFADPNQILVSRSYYDLVSRLTSEITELFSYSGIRMDKYVREHEVYRVVGHQDAAAAPEGAVARRLGWLLALPSPFSRSGMLAIGGVLVLAVLLVGVFFSSAKDDAPILPPDQAAAETADPGPAQPAETTPPKKAAKPQESSAWQKFVGTLKQGRDGNQATPACTDAQRMLKQCD